MATKNLFVAWVPLLILAAFFGFALFFPRVQLPSHLLNRTVIYKENFLDEKTHKYLAQLVKQQAVFPTNAADTLFFEAVEDMGEAIPIGTNGKCDHPFLVPNSKRTQCVIPGRIDVARGFIKSGGPSAFKEFYDLSVSRLLTFGRYNFDLRADPVISQLFTSSDFKNVAEAVCPPGRKYLDPFQYNFIINVPGQSVASHLDAVYFEHSNRFSAPQYLGLVMKFSGLWEDEFVPQNQVVAYLHDWEDDRDGNFIYWNDNSGEFSREKPRPRAGSAVDGSSLVHAGDVYRAGERPPLLDKSQSIRLEYRNATTSGQPEQWELMSNQDIVQTYTHDDLRICIVYRAKCFENEAAAKKYHDDLHNPQTWESVDSILTKLGKDLISKGKITQEQFEVYMNGSGTIPKTQARLDYAMLLVDTYVKYPLAPISATFMPFNYCALSIQFPFLKSILTPFCA